MCLKSFDEASLSLIPSAKMPTQAGIQRPSSAADQRRFPSLDPCL